MAGERLLGLVVAVKENKAQEALALIADWTSEEKEAIAYYLYETATFLKRVAKSDREDEST